MFQRADTTITGTRQGITMKSERLSIGQMAKLNHTTVATLRLYDKMGLLKPAYVDENTNYRYYSIPQSAVLRAIQYNKELGVTLKEIQHFIETSDYRVVEETYEQKIKDIEKQRGALLKQEKAIKRSLKLLRHYVTLPPVGTFTMGYVEPQYVYSVKAESNYFDDLDVYELEVIAAIDRMGREHIPNKFVYFTGTVMALENFVNQDFKPSRLFINVDKSLAKYKGIQVIPGGMYASIYCGDNQKIKERMTSLYKHLKEIHVKPTGDVILEMVGNLSREKVNEFQETIRIRVPVEFKNA
jgi:DNA-binding transcriptional MerR regulator